MFLTSQMLLSYQRCSRQVYLDTFGDRRLRGRPSDFRLKLSKDRVRYQKDFLESQPQWIKPQYPHRNWEVGADETLKLMAQGVSHIHGGVLRLKMPSGLTYISTPDLLTKESGVSVFGDWCYTPTDIKLSKRPKQEYQVLVAYHAYILSQMQGIETQEAWLYLREKGWYLIELELVLPKLLNLLPTLSTILLQQYEPEVFIVRNRCQLCAWFDNCYEVAQQSQHLSLLPGVTPSRHPILLEQGLSTVEALAALQPHHLNQKTGFGLSISQQLVYQARATVSQQPVLLANPQSYLTLENLPASPIELYFDIEAEPSINAVYLNGVLWVNRETGVQKFYPFLAEHPDQEQQAWEDFLAFVQTYPDAPIYHFCPYEVQTVKRLARHYGTPPMELEEILPRFIDIHRWVTQAVALPIENYTLKVIARWLGFAWRNTEANGAQSICWYEEWLNTGNRNLLDIIVEYNEDDCLATYRIKDWLLSFLAEQPINARCS